MIVELLFKVTYFFYPKWDRANVNGVLIQLEMLLRLGYARVCVNVYHTHTHCDGAMFIFIAHDAWEAFL